MITTMSGVKNQGQKLWQHFCGYCFTFQKKTMTMNNTGMTLYAIGEWHYYIFIHHTNISTVHPFTYR